MADDLDKTSRFLYRAELGAAVQQAKREDLAQRVTLTQSGMEEFFNKSHGKDGRFSSGKGGGGSLSDKRIAYQFRREDRELLEFEVESARQNGDAGTKDFRDLQKTAKSIEPQVAKARKDLFKHVDELKKDGGRKANKALSKEMESTDRRIKEIKGHIDKFKPTPTDSTLDKMAHKQWTRNLKEEQSYRDHLTGPV